MDQEFESRLAERLNEHHRWPVVFPFKFIITNDQTLLDQTRALFSENAEVRTKPSRNGKYISVTGKEVMVSAEAVLEVYRNAAKIQGIIAL